MSDDTIIVVSFTRKIARTLLLYLQNDIPIEPETAQAVLAALKAALNL